MGQIFTACAYDIENMRCCVLDADKFHANSYSFLKLYRSNHFKNIKIVEKDDGFYYTTVPINI